MSYKTSFNGLESEVRGVYSAYNLTPQEIEDINKRFYGKINGSGSNYTIYYKSKCCLWLKLFVHEIWIPIKIDIREDFLKLTKSNKVFEKDIIAISKKLKEQRIELHVSYDFNTNSWILENYDSFLETLKELI